jgi:diketogulonate reductase-like aldo/keto reductase
MGLAAAGIAREDIFVTTRLWNTNYRPERVEPAFEASQPRSALPEDAFNEINRIQARQRLNK